MSTTLVGAALIAAATHVLIASAIIKPYWLVALSPINSERFPRFLQKCR